MFKWLSNITTGDAHRVSEMGSFINTPSGDTLVRQGSFITNTRTGETLTKLGDAWSDTRGNRFTLGDRPFYNDEE